MSSTIQIRCSKETKDIFDSLVSKHSFRKKEDLIVAMMKTFEDVEYVSNQTTILNEYVVAAIDSSINAQLDNISQRIIKPLSELAINQSILLKQSQIDHMFTNEEISNFRKEAVDKMKIKDNVLSYGDVK